jgi:hypothetical protein
MSPFDINSVVFHFDDFNYGRRSQPIFFLTIATHLFFFIAYNKMKKIYITLSEQFQHSIEKSFSVRRLLSITFHINI